MIRAMLDFVRMLPVRLRAIGRLAADGRSLTYYPQEPRKSRTRVLLDNLWWFLRHQEVNYEYYLYGLDRKSSCNSEYLAKHEFRKIRDRANAAANAAACAGDTRSRRLNYRVLMGDKFVFNHYLAGLGFPTPRIVAIGNDQSILWLEGNKTVPLTSLLDREMDVYLKDDLEDAGCGTFRVKVQSGRLLINDKERTIAEFPAEIGIRGHYTIQECVRQHPKLAALHPHCANTIRLVTVRRGGVAEPLAAVLRVGIGAMTRDNWSKGGIALPIEMETGRLGKYGFFFITSLGKRVDRLPDSGVVFEGFEVPFFRDAVRLAVDLHGFFYGFHSIGWDIAIAETGPTFLEANDDWGTDLMQGPHGGLRKRFLAMLPGK